MKRNRDLASIMRLGATGLISDQQAIRVKDRSEMPHALSVIKNARKRAIGHLRSVRWETMVHGGRQEANGLVAGGRSGQPPASINLIVHVR